MKRVSLYIAVIPFVLFGFALSHAAEAAPVKYKIDKGSHLKVDVYHTAKHVIAKSKRVRGLVELTAGSGSYQLKGALSVRIKSLKSGNLRRDRVMWSSLGKSRQPYIYFYPKELVLKGKTGTLTGEFKIRKVSSKVTLTVTNVEGSLDGKAPVTVSLKGHLLCSTFKVMRPSLLFVKIKDKVDLSITVKLIPRK